MLSLGRVLGAPPVPENRTAFVLLRFPPALPRHPSCSTFLSAGDDPFPLTEKNNNPNPPPNPKRRARWASSLPGVVRSRRGRAALEERILPKGCPGFGARGIAV